jgi:hypothetical protein
MNRSVMSDRLLERRALEEPAHARIRGGALLAAVLLAIAAVRISLVAAYGNSIPYSDEWDSVIALPMRMLAQGSYSLLELLRPHNEHTLAPTRLVSLLQLLFNQNQFDNLPVALFNAVLIAAIWALPVVLFFRHAPNPERVFAVILALVGVAPIDGADLLFGFQNQYYFLVAGSLGTLWLAASANSASKRSLAAYGATALVTCISMGSGFFAPLLGAGICALRALREPAPRRGLLLRIAISLVAAGIGLGLLLHTGLVSSKQIDLAGIQRAFSCLAWPYATSPVAGALLTLPFALFSLQLLWRGSSRPLDWFAFGIGLWAAAQASAIAIDRHVDATSMAVMSRYLNIILFWPLMNVFSVTRLAMLLRERARSRAADAVLALLPVLAGVALIGCVVRLMPATLATIALAGQQHVQQADHVARYVRTGDPDALYGAGHMQLPYPDIPRLRGLLDAPDVRRGLPVNIRAPMTLAADAADAPAFIASGEYPTTPAREGLPDLGSYTSSGNPNTGTWRSQPLQTEYPYLVVGLAGYLPDPRLSLQLACANAPDCGSASVVVPAEFARESWHDLTVKVPAPRFRIVAEDHSTDLWFAFSAPLEAGRLSVAAAAFIGHLRADPLFWLGLVSAACVLLILLSLQFELPASRPVEN